ncbi:MAG: signal peptidase II [Gammaproteobacteria bacterium RIFCSPHIGHO2_12_FULL_45_9]|nr:MAG: signal peptidase II [Gammaproteobacteria bacterium RIFCSPHIGHO2_12_FULL_45_9]
MGIKQKCYARWYWVVLIVGVWAFDRFTKHWAETTLQWGMPVPVMPHLNWTLNYNMGVAFGFLHNHAWQSVLVLWGTGMLIVGLCVWLWRSRDTVRTALPLSLVIGGALGNWWDRLHHNPVIDFIDCYWGHWHFAIFNVADTFICVGMGILLLWPCRTKCSSH